MEMKKKHSSLSLYRTADRIRSVVREKKDSEEGTRLIGHAMLITGVQSH